MYWGLLQRTIFYDLAKVFLLSLFGLTAILLLAGVARGTTRGGSGDDVGRTASVDSTAAVGSSCWNNR